MSVIYYKFKAAKDSDYDVFTFDGPGATVFDLKREIITAKKLGKGTDFDLAIYNAQTDDGKLFFCIFFEALSDVLFSL
jgi:hypothetical protein